MVCFPRVSHSLSDELMGHFRNMFSSEKVLQMSYANYQ
jgi:hypothetical protein